MVGAAYSVAPETGDVATIIKLLRVVMLVPTVLSISILTRHVGPPSAGKRPPLIPVFLAAFVALVLLNSFHLVPSPIQAALSGFSRWCIVTAIAALGARTSLAALAQAGHRAMALMVAETAFIAVFVVGLVYVLGLTSAA